MSAVQEAAPAPLGTIRTQIPARLDRLPWARFHWMIILGLGTAWVLDGLEVTIVGAVGSRLTESGSGIALTVSNIGSAAAIYVAGACLGALFFGQLTDRFGRKRLFMVTLGIYIVSTVTTAFSFAPWFFFLARFFTGTGIGGEYAAINSAIDELIPARVRGRVDLIINGSYWVGSAAGSAAALFFLDTSIFAKDFGWRLSFGIGAVLGLAVLFVRRSVPESPRWLFIHGRQEEAEAIVGEIEEEIEAETGESLAPVKRTLKVRQREAIPFREIARVAFTKYPTRSCLCIALFVGQAFLYNGVVFNLGTLLTTFFAVSSGAVPIFTIIYAAGNFMGPLTLGRLFDTLGRKVMISATYFASAAVAVVLGFLFLGGGLTAVSFIVVIVAIFFLASAGASAAYLTASEIFPMETRALAIAFFYAIGTAVGGIAGPLLFGKLIASKKVSEVVIAFFIGAVVMALGGVAELLWGVRAEGQALEDIAAPLTLDDDEDGDGTDVAAAASTEPGGERAGALGEPEPSPLLSEARRERISAEEQRALAAERRAAAYDRLATRQSENAGGQGDDHERLARQEQRLAEAAELRARVHDEYAAAAQERFGAEHELDSDLRAAADERAAAARERGRAHEYEARAVEHDDSDPRVRQRDLERLGRLSAAARDRARAHEQLADAAAATARANDVGGRAVDVERARARMHELWAQMHEHSALAQERRAEHDDDGAAQAQRAADGLADRARAAAYRVTAAEHRAQAEHERLQDMTAAEAGRRRERDAARRAAEEELRERAARRRGRDQAGLRRYRPGPGLGPSAPVPAIADVSSGFGLDEHVEAIERALDEHGPTERRELEQLVGARYWGPGVFHDALREAVADGAVQVDHGLLIAERADDED